MGAPLRQVRMTPKAEDTRRRILQAALELFQERGFAETTMRDIAQRASVAVGAAYYYFDSKEKLVMDFYAQTQTDMQEASRESLSGLSGLRERLKAAIELKFDRLRPYRKVLGALFRSAADPASPISPFGEETREIREQSIQIFREALEGSDVRLPRDLREHLQYLLWLYHMGLILLWIHDASPDQARTERVMEKSLDLIARAIKLSRFALMAPIRRAALELLRSFHDEPRA